MSELERVFRCQFCGKKFARESWFSKHSCPKKKKFAERNDIMTQKGHKLFVYWLAVQRMIRHGRTPDLDTFMKSPLKKSFVRLAVFCQEQEFPSAYSYVDWLVEERIPERRWFVEEPDQIDRFKKFINLHEDPTDQAVSTKKFIERWVLEKEERTPDEFFAKLTPGRILTLVQQKHLRPWVLFGYEPVVSKWLDEGSYDREVFYRINDLVNCSYWADLIGDNPEGVAKVTEIMDQLWTPSLT